MNLRIISEKLEFNQISTDDFKSILENVYKNFKHADSQAKEGSAGYEAEPGWFCVRNEVFLQFDEIEGDGETISTDDSIFVRRRDGKTELIARENGYPVLHDGELSIFKPCRLTADKVHLFYIILPVRHGQKHLKEDFFIALSQPSKDLGIRNYTNDAVLNIINSGEIQTITISMGVQAKPGRRESLSILIEPGKKPAKKADGSIDYYSYSIYKEVQEGTILAEKIAGIDGFPGIDAFGNEIPVESNSTITFAAGENVRVLEKENGFFQFISEINGLLDLKKNVVGVLPELHITGDLGPETGSIVFSRNIIVEGSVQPCYRINCGGNLTVKGQIENGALIECGGNLFAEKGIIGEKTRLFVKGSMETDYLNDTKIRVLGDVLVHNTVYASELFCGGILTVEGKKMKTRNRGCIIGSKVTSMKKMCIQSAGSELSKTELICGVDNELKTKLDSMKQTIPVIDRKILRLQHGLGMDLGGHNIVERLKMLPPERKNEIKKKLEEIKTFAQQKSDIEKRIDKITDMVFNPVPEMLSISVSSHLLPDTVVNIGNVTLLIKDRYDKVEIRLSANKIVINK